MCRASSVLDSGTHASEMNVTSQPWLDPRATSGDITAFTNHMSAWVDSLKQSLECIHRLLQVGAKMSMADFQLIPTCGTPLVSQLVCGSRHSPLIQDSRTFYRASEPNQPQTHPAVVKVFSNKDLLSLIFEHMDPALHGLSERLREQVRAPDGTATAKKTRYGWPQPKTPSSLLALFVAAPQPPRECPQILTEHRRLMVETMATCTRYRRCSRRDLRNFVQHFPLQPEDFACLAEESSLQAFPALMYSDLVAPGTVVSPNFHVRPSTQNHGMLQIFFPIPVKRLVYASWRALASSNFPLAALMLHQSIVRDPFQTVRAEEPVRTFVLKSVLQAAQQPMSWEELEQSLMSMK